MNFLQRSIVLSVAAGCIALILAALVGSGTKALITWSRTQAARTPNTVLGISFYPTFFTVVSYNPASRELLADVRNVITGENILTRYAVSQDFEIKRRNAIVQDGVIVGIATTTEARMDEVVLGTRALGIVRLDEISGRIILHYLLIGDPFPRP